MSDKKNYFFENIRPSFNKLKTSKIKFKDSNDIINSDKNDQIVLFAKNLNCILLIFTSLFFFYIFFKVYYLTINFESTANSIKEVKLKRGKIFDRNGILLATNLPTYDLYINTRKLIDEAKVKVEIKEIFKKSSNFLNFVFSKDQYILIKSNLTQVEINRVKEIGDPSLIFEKSQKRIYPQHNLFSHVTGFLTKFYEPKSKLEKNLNHKLSSGGDIKISLDIKIQSIVHDELLKSMKKYEANSALALVMNVKNGEILSMVSLPDFDPNYPEKIKAYSENNLVTEARYEMGSTLKIFNAALAYEINSSVINNIFDVEFPYQITTNKNIVDEIKGEKKINFDDIFIKSSNIGSIKLLESIGFKEQISFFERIGLTDDVKIPGLNIVSNNLPNYWNETASKFISFGYGISISPISLASSFSTLVNGGFKIQPTIFLDQNNFKKPILKYETSEKINILLQKIVENGTGKKARVSGLKVGGKTGTSEKIVEGNYNHEKVITSFIGVFPINNPKYLTLVLFDEPKRKSERFLEYFGGDTAAPTFSKIVQKISPILNIENYLKNLAVN